LSVPLRVRDTAVGRLKLKLDDRSPTPEEEALIREVADQASQALESARLFQETQRALSETEVLYRASAAIGAADSPHAILRAITDHVLTPQIDRCFLARVDPTSLPGEPVVMVEAAWEAGVGESLGIGDQWSARDRRGALHMPILGEMLGTPSTELDKASSRDAARYIFSDVATSKQLDGLSRYALATKLGSKAAAAIPLFVGERPLGLLLIQSLDAPYEFSEREMRLYRTLADQAAIALEGMRLLEATRRRAERERLTAEISSRVRGSADVDTILRTAVRELGRSLRASDAWIELEFGDGDGASGAEEHLDDARQVPSGGDGDAVLRGEPTREGEE
jgi:GAF domain-containing protein